MQKQVTQQKNCFLHLCLFPVYNKLLLKIIDLKLIKIIFKDWYYEKGVSSKTQDTNEVFKYLSQNTYQPVYNDTLSKTEQVLKEYNKLVYF